MTARLVRFGKFEFDLQRQQLRRGGILVRLQPQPARLLGLLVERAGEVVTRDEIRAHLWPDGTWVDFEQGINHNIRRIRTVLGDDAASARFVETVPREGYRFFAGVELVDLTGSNGNGVGHASGNGNGHRPAVGSDGSARPWGRTAGVALATGLFAVLAVTVAFQTAGISPLRARDPEAGFQQMQLEQLTSQGSVWSAAIAPDGKHLAYSLWVGGGFGLQVKSLGSDTDLLVVGPEEKPIRDIVFSPDGEFIYYLQQLSEGPGYSSLHRVPTLGGTSREIVFDVDSGVGFSPDGHRIAFVRGIPTERTGLLVTTKIDGTDERIVQKWTLDPMLATRTPAWSPDGDTIAVVQVRHDGRPAHDIVLVDPRDGETRLLGSEWDGIAGLAWMPDGNDLMVTGAWPGDEDRRQIWRVRAADGTVARVSNDLNTYTRLSMVEDGSELVAIQYERSTHLWTMDPSGQAERVRWTRGSRPSDSVVNAQRLAGGGAIWATLRSDGLQLTYAPGPGKAAQPALPETLQGVGRFTVTPDGTLLAFDAESGDGITHVYRTALDGGEPVRLTDGNGELVRAACPGGLVVFSQKNVKGLWSLKEPGELPRKVTDLEAYSNMPACSPDGKYLALDTNLPVGDLFERHIVVVPIDGGPPVASHPWPSGRLLRWTPQGDLTFLGFSDWSPAVQRMNLETGEVETIRRIGGEVRTFDWTTDGEQLLVAWGSAHADAVRISRSAPGRRR